MKRHPIHNLFSLAACVGLLLGLTALTAGATPSASLSAAPDFALKSRAGDNLRLSEQVGDIVIVNFWASWCGPCRQELPAFEQMYQEYQDLGVTVLAVNVDDDPAKADVLLSDVDVSFPVLYDSAGEVSRLYDVNAMPTTVIVDRNGNTRLEHKGYKSGDEVKYEKAIKALLRE